PDPVSADTDVRQPAAVPSVPAEQAALVAEALPCQGDGVTGPRVQLVYARPANAADRYPSLAASFQLWAAQVDDIVNQSAAETGGTRRIRFVHDAACQPTVVRVQLSTTGDDNFLNTINEMRAQGYNRSDRKYLVWMDANVYCGIAEAYDDARPTADNPNNGRAGVQGMVARVDNGCWGSPNSVEAHELVHNLGAVQSGSPNATVNGHCTDDYDRMCYADGPGVTARVVCSSTSQENRLDCNKNDYFSTAPAPGGWLATHWNTANSVFLSGAATPPPSTTTTTRPPTTTTTRPPTTTTTTTRPPTTTTSTTSTTSTMVPPGPSQTVRFIDRAYRDLLARPVTGSESAFWVDVLAGGFSRTNLASILTTSSEYRRLVVGRYYQTFLGRAATTGEMDVLSDGIAQGWTFDLVAALIAATDEFYVTHGSSPGSYVDALNRFAVGTVLDSGGRAFWVDHLIRGTSRLSVAQAFFNWSAAREHVVRQDYTEFVDRPADAAGLAFWTDQLVNGFRVEYMHAFFVGSGEYWSKS
ncbi:MAG: DUF4214 domain-containing protein, partial [Actinobacteria bacterium]|nr:DUF4214 domain-containing protein [Actinomycetota bacterium]